MFYSQNIKIFEVLENPGTQKSVTSTLTLLHVRSFTFDCFFRNQGPIKKKLDQILVPIMPNISIFPINSRSSHDFDKIAA